MGFSMTRTLQEWVGKNDDEKPPPRVLLRLIVHYDARCACCTRPIGGPILWQTDHIIAIINGGKNSESNLQPLCLTCHQDKTGSDIREKSMIYAKKLKHYNIKPGYWKRRYRALIGTKASGWRKRMDGTLERR